MDALQCNAINSVSIPITKHPITLTQRILRGMFSRKAGSILLNATLAIAPAAPPIPTQIYDIIYLGVYPKKETFPIKSSEMEDSRFG